MTTDPPADPVGAYLADARFDAERQGLSDEQAARLLAALEAALAMHSPDLTEAIPYPCKSDPFVWPCPTYRAISAELPGTADDEAEASRADTDCICKSGDGEDCPCEADGPDGLCACCRTGDHRGACAAALPGEAGTDGPATMGHAGHKPAAPGAQGDVHCQRCGLRIYQNTGSLIRERHPDEWGHAAPAGDSTGFLFTCPAGPDGN
jgi:hypothetical protein